LATILITGGAGGIGSAVARRLASDGETVVIADLDLDAAERAAAETGAASAIQMDVSKPEDCERAVAAVVERHGDIDGVVCCAGLFRYVSADELDEEHLDLLLRVNVKGTFHTCQAVARRILASGHGGSMVLFSSGAGVRAVGAPAYSASKGAIDSLTQELSLAWAEKGIRVNAIAPGVIVTEMSLEARSDPETIEAFMKHTPMRRTGEAEEVAAATSFLLSDEASYITAAVLPVDGGFQSV
jgi:NAD(P)-dependent dehydrogenase (short-subunit alcohol dehydrogenase family)